MISNKLTVYFLLISILIGCKAQKKNRSTQRNFIIVFTDDQRFDALGSNANSHILTPSLDSLSQTGINFKNAFVTLSICSPSRAALLTGRYGSANGVVTYGKVSMDDDEKTFANYLNEAGYQTGLVGKWHLKNSPASAGFDFASYFFSNGPWYDREVREQGEEKIAHGFIEDYNADQGIRFLEQRKKNTPFLLFLNPQLPHLDHNHKWNVRKKTIGTYHNISLEPPENWKDDLSDKPPYLKTGRHRQLAIEYGYRNQDTLIKQTKRYYAAITEMDATLGRVCQYIKGEGLDEDTYIIVMGDNGWFIGDHLFTSKVLAYEESMRVPFFITGPGINPGKNNNLVLNIDVMPTLLELANIEIPNNVHGKSLVPLLESNSEVPWRDQFYYEAPQPQLGSWPLYAVRTQRYKYIRTYKESDPDNVAYEELYDLENDPHELSNVIDTEKYQEIEEALSRDLDSYRKKFRLTKRN